jgi:hypothetical protein
MRDAGRYSFASKLTGLGGLDYGRFQGREPAGFLTLLSMHGKSSSWEDDWTVSNYCKGTQDG